MIESRPLLFILLLAAENFNYIVAKTLENCVMILVGLMLVSEYRHLGAVGNTYCASIKFFCVQVKSSFGTCLSMCLFFFAAFIFSFLRLVLNLKKINYICFQITFMCVQWRNCNLRALRQTSPTGTSLHPFRAPLPSSDLRVSRVCLPGLPQLS